jgi:hypothetical protein
MTRVFLGRDVEVVRETREGLELTGTMRLRPGFMVDLVAVRTSAEVPEPRRAFVALWKIRSLGRNGPTYRGFCRWQAEHGHELPVDPGGEAEVRRNS